MLAFLDYGYDEYGYEEYGYEEYGYEGYGYNGHRPKDNKRWYDEPEGRGGGYRGGQGRGGNRVICTRTINFVAGLLRLQKRWWRRRWWWGTWKKQAVHWKKRKARWRWRKVA